MLVDLLHVYLLSDGDTCELTRLNNNIEATYTHEWLAILQYPNLGSA